jgi:hypothetical protein
MKYALTLITACVLVVPSVALGAGSLSQSDFSACNQQAMAAAGVSGSSSPSASPSMSGTGPSGTVSPGTTTGSSSTMGSGSTGPGAAPQGTVGSSGAGSTVGGSTSTTTGSAGVDAQLDTIVQAYRSCLKSRM